MIESGKLLVYEQKWFKKAKVGEAIIRHKRKKFAYNYEQDRFGKYVKEIWRFSDGSWFRKYKNQPGPRLRNFDSGADTGKYHHHDQTKILTQCG